MSTTIGERKSSASNPFHPPQSARGIQRQFSNGCLVVCATLCALLAVGVLIYLILYVILNGLRYLNLDFFTKLPTPNGEPGGGMGPAIQGTIILVGLASLIGIPLGIFTAIYLSEFIGHHHDSDRRAHNRGRAAPGAQGTA